MAVAGTLALIATNQPMSHIRFVMTPALQETRHHASDPPLRRCENDHRGGSDARFLSIRRSRHARFLEEEPFCDIST
jgi:hypothetical protein